MRKKWLVITVFIGVIFSGCVKELDIVDQANFKSKIVVYGYAFANEPMAVIVSKSKVPGVMRDTDIISDALVALYQKTEVYDQFYVKYYDFGYYDLVKVPVYYTSKAISSGQEYQLKVFWNDTLATANIYIPEPQSFASVDFPSISFTISDTTLNLYYPEQDSVVPTKVKHINIVNSIFSLKIKDVPAKPNFYLVYYKLFGLMFDQYTFIIYLKSKEQKLSSQYVYIGNFGEIVYTPNTPKDLFYSAFPAWIYKFDDTTDNLIPVIGFSDEDLDGQEIELKFKVENLSFYDFDDTLKIYAYLIAVNEDTYKFFKSYAQYMESYGIAIEYPLFFEPVILYSNIQGGYGIAIGANVTRDTLYYELQK